MYENGTFGSYTEYGTLPLICERMNLMIPKKSEYLASFIHDFNKILLNGIVPIEDRYAKIRIIEFIKEHYLKRLLEMEQDYDPYLISHLRNFVITRLKRWMIATA